MSPKSGLQQMSSGHMEQQSSFLFMDQNPKILPDQKIFSFKYFWYSLDIAEQPSLVLFNFLSPLQSQKVYRGDAEAGSELGREQEYSAAGILCNRIILPQHRKSNFLFIWSHPDPWQGEHHTSSPVHPSLLLCSLDSLALNSLHLKT